MTGAATTFHQRVRAAGAAVTVRRASSLFLAGAVFWLAVGGAVGLLLPVLQLFPARPDRAALYGQLVTIHGLGITFGGLFQLMVAMSLTAVGSAPMAGPTRPAGWVAARAVTLLWVLVNGGLGLASAAAAVGFAPSYVLNFPLPVVGPALGLWSPAALFTGLTGVALLLAAFIIVYPGLMAVAILGRPREWAATVPALLRNPGMLGMGLASLILPIAGLPVLVAAGTVYLSLLTIGLPTAALTEPFAFNLTFWLFAHNLMEVMGIMGLAAVYRLLPTLTHLPNGRLASPQLGILAIVLYAAAAGPAFGHHLYTMVSSTPPSLQAGAQAASWATGFAAAFTAFNVAATLWRGGFRPSPGGVLLLAGFALYLLDGFVALELSTQAWNLQLHGTLYVTGHTMTILIALVFIWEGALILDRQGAGRTMSTLAGTITVEAEQSGEQATAGLRRARRRWVPYLPVGISTAGALGTLGAFLVGGAEGLIRRADPWGPGSGPVALAILVSGLALAIGQGSLLLALRNPDPARSEGSGSGPAAGR